MVLQNLCRGETLGSSPSTTQLPDEWLWGPGSGPVPSWTNIEAASPECPAHGLQHLGEGFMKPPKVNLLSPPKELWSVT